jgi:glycosyltransferase involved in cell wall biosynthesis
MRVAFITNFSSYYRRPLFEELARRWDVDFMFFSLGGERYRSAEMAHEQGQFKTVPLRRRSIRAQVYTPDLARLIARGNYDVVVKCLNGKLMVPLTCLSARRAGVPVVLWTGMWEHPTTSVHKLTAPLVRSTYRGAEAVVVYGDHVKAYLEDRGVDPARIFVAGQAVEGDRFARATQASPSSPLALYVGQLEERKGIRYLVEAFRALPGDQLRLRLVGSGSLGPWIEEQARMDKRIEPVGYCAQSDLPDEYAAARCVVLSSVRTRAGREPWGLVVNEAMHAGKPVIATDSVGAAAGGLVVDGQNGYVVPERNASALATALDRVLHDEDLASRLGAQASTSVKRFTFEAMADAFEQACASASANRRGRPTSAAYQPSKAMHSQLLSRDD